MACGSGRCWLLDDCNSLAHKLTVELGWGMIMSGCGSGLLLSLLLPSNIKYHVCCFVVVVSCEL